MSLAACSSAPLDTAPPQRFDLSGRWLLLADLSDRGPGAAAYDISRPVEVDPAKRTRSRRFGGNFAFIAHDFPVIRASRMEIEQNRDSMGVAYDRGAYRDLSWGTRERGLWQVDTGWNDEGELVSRWNADDAKVLERYTLSSDAQQLTVTVEVSAGNDNFNIRRVFSRAGGS